VCHAREDGSLRAQHFYGLKRLGQIEMRRVFSLWITGIKPWTNEVEMWRGYVMKRTQIDATEEGDIIQG
jgi:hypothetical protein